MKGVISKTFHFISPIILYVLTQLKMVQRWNYVHDYWRIKVKYSELYSRGVLRRFCPIRSTCSRAFWLRWGYPINQIKSSGAGLKCHQYPQEKARQQLPFTKAGTTTAGVNRDEAPQLHLFTTNDTLTFIWSPEHRSKPAAGTSPRFCPPWPEQVNKSRWVSRRVWSLPDPLVSLPV